MEANNITALVPLTEDQLVSVNILILNRMVSLKHHNTNDDNMLIAPEMDDLAEIQKTIKTSLYKIQGE